MISNFATIAQLFCYALSGEVSGESPVICPASSTSFFYFVGEPFFATLKQNRDFFCYPAEKRTRVSTGTLGLQNQIPRETPSTVPKRWNAALPPPSARDACPWDPPHPTFSLLILYPHPLTFYLQRAAKVDEAMVGASQHELERQR
jgi:hypothetical protein